MEIIPVIYVLDGKCVALYKGDYNQKDTYGGTPLEWARRFQREGADKIYLADLNARKERKFIQKDLFKDVLASVEIPVIVEAAFNNKKDIQEALDMGAYQVVLRSPKIEFLKKMLEVFSPEKIMVQIFAKRTELIEDRIKRYAEDYTDVVDYAEKLIPLRIKYVMYKDRRSEGILTNPNYDEIDRLFLTTGKQLRIYSSGGISELHHLTLLKKIGASGAMIGKALFERMLSISEAKEAVA